VRALTRTYACTNPNMQMHTHIHALHAYNGDTHIHARTTHMQTHVVGVGVETCFASLLVVKVVGLLFALEMAILGTFWLWTGPALQTLIF